MPIRKLYLELTDRCNLNCEICYRRSWNNSTGDMTEAVYQNLLAQLGALGSLTEIVLGGIGEPTVSALFSKAIRDLSAYDVTVTTNGIIEDREKLESMARYASRIVVSVDGLEDSYRKIRGSGLEPLCEAIRYIQGIKQQSGSVKPDIYLQFVLSSENKDDLLGVMALARELDVKGLIVSNLIPMTPEGSKKILYSRYQNDEMKEYLNQVCKESLSKGLHVMLPYCELKTERKCSFVESDSAFVCASGEVSPCHRFSHQYEEFVFGRRKTVQKYSFGNINRQSLKEIWDSQAFTRFRDMVRCSRYPSCTDCDLADGCDFARRSEMDCDGNSPSCADCLWSRKIAICP